MYDSIERGAADECKPLTGRRPRTFTLTQLLVACVAVCVCSIAATTAVHRLSQDEPPDIEPRPDPPEPLDEPFRKAATTVVNTHRGPSRLANFDLGSAFDDDSAEKKRKAEEKERECDRQATEKRNQCLAQPALGSSLGMDEDHEEGDDVQTEASKKRKVEGCFRQCLVGYESRWIYAYEPALPTVPPVGSPIGFDGVHATSFALGSAVTLTLVAVAYLVRRSSTKITDSSTYAATTVK